MPFKTRYMKTYLLSISLLSAGLSLHAQQNFQLKGEIKNVDKPYVYLSYNNDGARITDSARIQNNKFTLKGKVGEPVMATLYLDPDIRSFDDPNLLSFYLEPKNMSIGLESGKFKEAVVKGSKTQDEWSSLDRSKQPIQQEMEAVLQEYDKRHKAYTEAAKELQALELKVKKMKEDTYAYRDNFEPFNARKKALDLAFIKANPDSYVSAYLLRFMVAGSKLDQLEALYGGLSDRVQNSSYGLEISKEIEEFKSGSPGSKAYEFRSTDINGKPLALTDFRGQYVLLDFWASWCVPCRKGNPHLISLYNKYKADGFEIIGVADDDRNHEAWHKAVEQDGIEIWKHVLRGLKYENGEFDRSNAISDHFGTSTLPTKILVNPEGVIIGRYAADADTDADLDKKLIEIFGK